MYTRSNRVRTSLKTKGIQSVWLNPFPFDAFCCIDKCWVSGFSRLVAMDNAIFSNDEYNETIVFWCDQGRDVGLQITHRRFKEALTPIMEDEAFRVDD